MRHPQNRPGAKSALDRVGADADTLAATRRPRSDALMCGIAGLWDLAAATSADGLRRLTTAMSDSLTHRGPDDGGVWVDEAAGLGFGQRRLSIVDLSPAGHQPMVSACGRYVIVYNGEVYSHEEMRPELTARGIRFRGHSDTEVILEAMAAWGVEATVKRLIGMFAIALWDRETRTLSLVRDRLGGFGQRLVNPNQRRAHGHRCGFVGQPVINPAFRLA